MTDTDSRALPVDPLLKWVCVVAILAGCAFSLGGQCLYEMDLDRDFERTSRLIGGDLGVLLHGQLQAGKYSTLSGLYYAILAPAMLVSSRLEWLFVYLEAFTLLGLIPLWSLCRTFGGPRLAWPVVALFAISSSRVYFCHTPLHSSIALMPALWWHWLLVRFTLRPRLVLGVLLGLDAAVLLSLHLSFLSLILAGPAVFFLYRVSGSSVWRRSLTTRRIVVLLVAGIGGLVGALLLRTGGALKASAARVLNGCAALAEQVGFVVDGPLVPHLQWKAMLWRYAPAALLCIGLLAVAQDWKRARGGLHGVIREEHKRLFHVWMWTVLVAQLAGAILFATKWESFIMIDDIAVRRYRFVAGLGPVAMIALVLGIFQLSRFIAARSSVGWTAGRVAAALVLVLGATHAFAVARSEREQPWRITGPAVQRLRMSPLEACTERWGFSRSWIREAAFIEGGLRRVPIRTGYWTILPNQQNFRFLFEQATTDSPRSGQEPPFDEALFLVEPGGEIEQQLRATHVVSDVCDASGMRAYLCVRNAGHLLPLQPYCAFLSIDEHGRPREEASPRIVRQDSPSSQVVLLASNLACPPELGCDALFEVVIERGPEGLRIGARLYGRPTRWDFQLGGAELRGPYVIVRSDRRAETVRFDIPFGEFLRLGDPSNLAVSASLDGWQAADVSDVRCGLESWNPRIDPRPLGGEWTIFEDLGSSAATKR